MLVSLWDMLRVYAEEFVRLAQYVSSIEWAALNYITAQAGGPEDVLQRDAASGRLKHELKSLKEECERLGLTSAPTHIDRFLPIDPLTHDLIVNFMQDIPLRLQEDLAKERFIQIPPTRATLYGDPMAGWEAVTDRIGCKFDISEAGICLALERNTACVFHLIGVIQACLNALARSLRLKIDLETATWNVIIVKMESAIREKQSATDESRWKKKLEPFYSEAIIDVKAPKNAWRNPTLHFWKSATDAEARKVYDRTKDFALLIAGGPLKFRTVPS